MAKIVEDVLVIKFSKLVKEGVNEDLVTAEIQASLEAVAQELVGDGIIVEVEKP